MARPMVAGILFDVVKTIVAVLVWNRFENLQRWLHCWKQCERSEAELIVIHNLEKNNERYATLCRDNGIQMVPRPNVGFDLGAFQDVCKERLCGFPNDWDNLIWMTDDCIPMRKDWVAMYLNMLRRGTVPCYEISDEYKRHVRTTGFMVTKEISRRLVFPADPILIRESCYEFEHRGDSLFLQMRRMGAEPGMVEPNLASAPVWDFGCRGYLQLMSKHEAVFSKCPETHEVEVRSHGLLDDLAIKHHADKCSRYHNFAEKYDRAFAGMRESTVSLLEIGVAQGQSLRMWVDYFPNAMIHGADISPACSSCESYSSRIKFHLLDQSNAAQLKNVEQYSPFDIIIDDGNHWWKEQILTFEIIFQYLRSGGIYVVEDSCTSYWSEYKNHPISCVEYFKRVVDEVNLRGRRGSVPANPPSEFTDWHKGWHRREDCHKLTEFESIHFMNSLIFIYRR